MRCEETIKEYREKQEENGDEDDFVDGNQLTRNGKRRIRNRFSSRNSTIRGINNSDGVDIFESITNAKLMIAGVVFLILNILFSRFCL